MFSQNRIVKLVFGMLLAVGTSIPLLVWGQANLENPADGGKVSGIGLIRGWRCEPPTWTILSIG